MFLDPADNGAATWSNPLLPRVSSRGLRILWRPTVVLRKMIPAAATPTTEIARAPFDLPHEFGVIAQIAEPAAYRRLA